MIRWGVCWSLLDASKGPHGRVGSAQVEEESQMAIGLPKIVSGAFQEPDLTSGSIPKLVARKQVALAAQVKNVLERVMVLQELVSGGSVSESQRVVEELCPKVAKAVPESLFWVFQSLMCRHPSGWQLGMMKGIRRVPRYCVIFLSCNHYL